MKDDHIISLLDGAPLGSLSEREQASIRDHVGRCAECRRAHEAAQISARLLTERAALTVEPSPFFHTRVLAALRQRQVSSEPSALGRMWAAAGWLVSSMTAAVMVLAALTFFTRGYQPPSGVSEFSGLNLDSAERVIFAPDNVPDDEITYSQVLAALYEPEDKLGSSYEPRQ